MTVEVGGGGGTTCSCGRGSGVGAVGWTAGVVAWLPLLAGGVSTGSVAGAGAVAEAGTVMLGLVSSAIEPTVAPLP